MTMHRGKTKDAQSPFLTWKKGMSIQGTVTRQFETTTGQCFEISLAKPMTVEGQSEKKVSINGEKSGIRMALNAAGLEGLEIGDKIILGCTGTTPTNKGNPRVDFEIAVDRPS